MTKLTFAPAPQPGADLPIEVRKGNMALVARTMASQPLVVEPGTYFVTTRAPDGEENTERIVVTPDDREIEVPVLWPAPRQEKPRLLGDKAAAEEPWVESVQVFTGNVFAGPLSPAEVPDTPRRSRAGEPLAHVDGKDVPQFARVVTPFNPDGWIALPAWGDAGCRLFVHRFSQPPIRILLEHQQANLLLRLQNLGRLADAESTSRSESLTAEQLLFQKRRDPIAAVVGAYALLRFNDIERLHDWTKRLYAIFPELPDAAVICGEHLARLGEHREGLRALLDLPNRGLPLFSEGIRLALDRLQLYSGHDGDTFTGEQIKEASSLAAHLKRFAASTDFTRPLTTLSIALA